MSIIYGIIAPHPPIIIPEIGRGETKKVQATIKALEKLALEIKKLKPNKLIVISPHLEHGFDVPLYYLAKHLDPKTKLEKILVTNPSYKYYADLGKEIAKKENESKEKTVIIASGDLSHVLKEEGPYGFNPAGPKLDKMIIGGIKNKDLNSLLSIDFDVLEQGAECGLRSILFLLGAFEGLDYQSEILSYEGPFGVGYLVASLKLNK